MDRSLKPLPFTSACQNVLDVAELAHLVAQNCSVSSLMNYSNVCRGCKLAIIEIIKHRIFSFLARYIGDQHIVAFLDLLRDTKSAIIGSFAFAVLHPDPTLPITEAVGEIKVAVPLGDGVILKWAQFFRRLGCRKLANVRPSFPYYGVIKRSVAFHLNGQIITIIQSLGSSVLPVVLSSPATTMLNFMTDANIYCFYPRLCSRGIALKGYATLEDKDERHLKNRNIAIYTTNDFMEGPCLETCPKLWRYSQGLKGIGFFQWRGWSTYREDLRDNRTTDHIKDSRFKWRLAMDCYNRHCPRSIYALYPPPVGAHT